MAAKKRKGGRHALKDKAPRIWNRHDGARGLAYRRTWLYLVQEYGQPPRDTLRSMDMARCAAALVYRAECARDLEDAVRAVEQGGRGRSRAEVRRLEARHLRADSAALAARELLDRVTRR